MSFQSFGWISLARQFLLVSLGILLIGMALIGMWVSRQIESGVLNRTAAITALYVDSFVSPYLQGLSDDPILTEVEMGELDQLIRETPLGQEIVSFKVWSSDGRILYSPERALVGLSFGVDSELTDSIAGDVVSSVSNLDRPEHAYERMQWDRLIETYAPVRKAGTEEILAISEFYQLPGDLEVEIRSAQLRSWLVVGISTVVMYLLLAGMVGRASRTIQAQRAELENRLGELQVMLKENETLNSRVRRAGARTTALNEQFLRRISADLHDGLGQDLTLALMRIETFRQGYGADRDRQANEIPGPSDLEEIQSALNSAVDELRAVTAGLRLPELDNYGIGDVAVRAIRSFESKTGLSVDFEIGFIETNWPISAKIAVYRVIQEALANSYRHSGSAERRVKLWESGGVLCAEVCDDGKGFDQQLAASTVGLGLAGMRERVQLLGGTFKIVSNPGRGTIISFSLPQIDA